MIDDPPPKIAANKIQHISQGKHSWQTVKKEFNNFDKGYLQIYLQI